MEQLKIMIKPLFVMQEYKLIHAALTTTHHFEQAGFQI